MSWSSTRSSGAVWAAKASTTPDNFADGVLAAIHAGKIDPTAVAAFVHGTTVVINAITQRRGVKTALVTTAGFRDVLEIGRGNRPDMYNLKFHKPKPFVPRRLRFEVRERVGADGSVWTPLATEDLEAIVDCLSGARGWRQSPSASSMPTRIPEHEEAAAAFLRERLPGVLVTASSEITREWREFERSSTAVLNAYVQPILDGYLSDLEKRLRAEGLTAPVFAMLSNGGTATFEAARQDSDRPGRVRAGRRRHRRGLDRPRHRRPQHHRPRHRGDDGQVLVDRRRRGQDHDRLPVGGDARALPVTR